MVGTSLLGIGPFEFAALDYYARAKAKRPNGTRLRSDCCRFESDRIESDFYLFIFFFTRLEL